MVEPVLRVMRRASLDWESCRHSSAQSRLLMTTGCPSCPLVVKSQVSGIIRKSQSLVLPKLILFAAASLAPIIFTRLMSDSLTMADDPGKPLGVSAHHSEYASIIQHNECISILHRLHTSN
ncbi:hypothetical protein CC79DRAFT_1333839, partial [Sarocladium strictum]